MIHDMQNNNNNNNNISTRFRSRQFTNTYEKTKKKKLNSYHIFVLSRYILHLYLLTMYSVYIIYNVVDVGYSNRFQMPSFAFLVDNNNYCGIIFLSRP